jgi:hypothetical protein
MSSEPPAEQVLASLAAMPEALQHAFGTLTAAARAWLRHARSR